MKVIYGSVVDIEVADDLNPNEVMDTLKGAYSELENATYAITTESGARVMRISLRTGSKA